MKELPGFTRYLSVRRTSQELLWSLVGASVERQKTDLNDLADHENEAHGSLSLDPAFDVPEYLSDRDVHLMPGGYAADPGRVEQGAVMDRGGAIYMLGRNGGFLNDGRGWSLASHLFNRWPDIQPQKILELGCGIGPSTIPLSKTFPGAEAFDVDVGASMLRYAHARAEKLGAAIHFHQADAENTSFPDNSVDLVYSCALMHETSKKSLDRIVDESFRLLKPGGVCAHLEVPQRSDDVSLWTMIRGEIEYDYNNEPNWKAAISADYTNLMRIAGFENVAAGFQDATRSAERGNDGFGAENKGTFRSWFVVSEVKP